MHITYIVTRRLERLEPPSRSTSQCHDLSCARPEYSGSGQAIVNAPVDPKVLLMIGKPQGNMMTSRDCFCRESRLILAAEPMSARPQIYRG